MTDALRSGIDLDELSPGIRPQDDLFRHVNGAWIDRTEIPDDKARWGSFHLIAEQAEKDVRAIVEESQDAAPGTEARKIGDDDTVAWGPTILATVIAFAVGYAVIAWLLRWLTTRSYLPFVLYRLALGGLLLILLGTGVLSST